MNNIIESEEDINNILDGLKNWKLELKPHHQALDSSIEKISLIARNIRSLPKSSYLIDNLISEILSHQEFLPKFNENHKYLQKLREITSKEKVKYELDFYKILKETLSNEGIEVIGNPPNFLLKPFHLQINMKVGKASLLLGREVLTDTILLNPQEIHLQYKRYFRLICERKFQPDVFLSQLFLAYDRVFKTKEYSAKSNRKINIIDVLNELVFIIQSPKFHHSHKREDFKSYPRSYFLYDIYQLQQSQNLQYGNYKLSFSSATIDTTGKSDRMLYFPDMKGDTRPIMAIEFIEVET